jgi:hypothetical protein
MPITRNSIRYPGFFTRRKIMFRPIQNPQRLLSHALIVNSRTSFGHPVNNIPIVRKSKKANTKGITFRQRDRSQILLRKIFVVEFASGIGIERLRACSLPL